MGRCPRERRTLARSPDRPLARGTGAPPAFPGRGGPRRLRSPGPPALRGSASAAAPKNRRGCPGSPSSRPSPAAPSSPLKQRPREGKSGESCQHEGESGLGSPATPVGGCSGDLRLSRDGGMREWLWILRGNPQRRGCGDLCRVWEGAGERTGGSSAAGPTGEPMSSAWETVRTGAQCHHAAQLQDLTPKLCQPPPLKVCFPGRRSGEMCPLPGYPLLGPLPRLDSQRNLGTCFPTPHYYRFIRSRVGRGGPG